MQRLLVAVLLFLSISSIVSCASKKVQEIPPQGSLDLRALAERTGFTMLPVSRQERSLLAFSLPREQQGTLQSTVLLWDGERVAGIFYIDSSDAPNIFQRLKGETFEHFSLSMTGLRDEIVEREGYHPMDLLAFIDPSLLDEQFLFVRIGTSLYEFHIPEGKEVWVQGLLLELARL